jgi:plasmid stabilization system protein ParE
MARLKLFWTETALNQRTDTFKFWNDKNNSNLYSKRLALIIKDRTDRLLVFPEIDRKINFKNIRVISIEHFSLFYEIVEDKIVITSFWDNRRDPKKLLKLLKKK